MYGYTAFPFINRNGRKTIFRTQKYEYPRSVIICKHENTDKHATLLAEQQLEV